MPDRVSATTESASFQVRSPAAPSARLIRVALAACGLARATTPARPCVFLPELEMLLATAVREISAHVNAQGLCTVCRSPFPYRRAELAEFTLGSLAPSPGFAPSGRRYAWLFPGTADQVGKARRMLAEVLDHCPIADDVILCLSELAANAVQHSASGRPGGTFTVRAEIRYGWWVVIEVEDNGGPWRPPGLPDGRMHGLAIVRELAADVGVHGSAARGWAATARFGWPAGAAGQPADLSGLNEPARRDRYQA